MNIETDCAIIGGGFAGLSAALEAAEAGMKVDLFIKGAMISDTASNLTAGGLAAVPLVHGVPVRGDSLKKHIQDTLEAGQYLNDRKVVRYCAEHFYTDVIEWLVGLGVQFDMVRDGSYDLHREGGHSAKRIFHVGDSTGAHVMAVLAEKARNHPNIRIHERHAAVDLITKNKFLHKKGRDECLGVYVYDLQKDRVKTVSSRAVFLAAGGLGKVFLYTSNPDSASGDGFAMAYRAGLPLVNMEFIQFHPTVFFDERADPSERRFLLTEALRGEGAFLKLRRNDREDFVLKYHPLGSAATRDVVTRAEDMEMRKQGLKHLWLDCTRLPGKRLRSDFKGAYEFCMKKGFDISRDPIPVVYAVHYSNGGVQTDLNGATGLENLYVLGETACTGLHGATRLASNSSTECVLFARNAARHFAAGKVRGKRETVPNWDNGRAKENKDPATISYYWEITRKTMTLLCGVARTEGRLRAAKDVLWALQKNVRDDYWNYRVSRDFLEARNLATVANVILDSALARRESRACHYREDFPKTDRRFNRPTVVRKGKDVSRPK
jgi:L-aspartate oxidase